MNLKTKFGERDDDDGERPDIENYSSPGQVRNICFVQPDGRKLFLNYAYLVSGEYVPEGNIILTFTTHEVTLKGRNLEGLYDLLMEQKLKSISVIEERYVATKDEIESLVTEISIVHNN